MGCEFKDKCKFFLGQMDNMPATTNVFKKMYCDGLCDNCARHMVGRRMGNENIPAGLLPNQRKDAISMLSLHTV